MNRKVKVCRFLGHFRCRITRRGWQGVRIMALVDLVLFLMLDEVVVCYACGAVHRDFPKNADIPGFNLVVLDRYEKRDGVWKIAHYSLTLLVPNERAPDVIRVIRGQ